MKQQYNKLQFIKDKQINETTKQQKLKILLIFQMNLQFIVYSFATLGKIPRNLQEHLEKNSWSCHYAILPTSQVSSFLSPLKKKKKCQNRNFYHKSLCGQLRVVEVCIQLMYRFLLRSTSLTVLFSTASKQLFWGSCSSSFGGNVLLG